MYHLTGQTNKLTKQTLTTPALMDPTNISQHNTHMKPTKWFVFFRLYFVFMQIKNFVKHQNLIYSQQLHTPQELFHRRITN